MSITQRHLLLRRHLSVAVLLLSAPLLVSAGCTTIVDDNGDHEPQTLVNLDHLDWLGETVIRQNAVHRIIHIYAEAPDYAWVADPNEGAACVDDAARAAVVYLRHFELTGTASSREKAEQLLRFVMYMQRDDGLFYNFVWGSDLAINRDHPNSRAEPFSFWAARAVWALGMCADVLREANPDLADACVRRISRTFPHLEAMLDRHPNESSLGGRRLPLWLVYESASDATSELLLGLTALHRARPDVALRSMIDRFADGIALMQYGSMTRHPYGAHASWRDVWHGWGNSQTQAVVEAGRLSSAMHEAEHFYPRLLIDGWRHSISLDDPEDFRTFEQIAYAVRPMTVGLLRLYEATGDRRYAIMAGLSASWLRGNNVASAVMYDHNSGRGYDGINGASSVNRNSGAESTIEAVYTILEVERHPDALRWIEARGSNPESLDRGGKSYRYRIFSTGAKEEHRVALVMNLTDESLQVLEGAELSSFLN
jgi:hypothetical protein